MNDSSFIGLGHNPNPNVPDIPEGFGAALSKEPEAQYYYNSLSDTQKTNVIEYLQSNNETGDDARNKIDKIVNNLKNRNFDFTNLNR